MQGRAEMGFLPRVGKEHCEPSAYSLSFQQSNWGGCCHFLKSLQSKNIQRRLKRLFTEGRNKLGMFLFSSRE